MEVKKCVLGLLLISCLLLTFLDSTEGKKSRDKDETDGRPNRQNIESDRSKLFEGLQEPETSAQAVNPAFQNGAFQQGLGGAGGIGGIGGLGGLGGLANLGGGVFQNQGLNNPYLNAYQQNPYQQQNLYQQNPYNLLGGGGGIGGGFGGLGGQFGGIGTGIGGQFGGIGTGIAGQFGGIGGGLGGIAPDIYTQGALAAQLYNNPLYGAGSQTLSGSAAGINPLLLRGAQNSQYPVVGGLGAYNNPYLAAQALLSPYSNYNQYNPFSSRFGVGAGNGRSGLTSRYNSQSNSNSRSNDE